MNKSTDQPFFSIIVPTYNREEYISKAIQSIIHQSFKNWELIIIDDGSTDNTKDIVQEYLPDSRIRYFYQKNQERSASRNNGIKHSNGNWICFLDSDDYYHETHLQRFKDLIDKNKSKPGLYLCGFSINQYCQDKMEYNHSSRNNLEFVLINSFSTPRACISSSIAKIIPFDNDIRIGEDTELWIRILLNHPLFYHEYKTVIQLEHSERSVNSNVFYCDLKTKIYILSKLDKKQISSELRRNIISQCFFNIAKYEMRNGNRFVPIRYLIKSLIRQPKHIQNKFKINLIIRLIFTPKKALDLIL